MSRTTQEAGTARTNHGAAGRDAPRSKPGTTPGIARRRQRAAPTPSRLRRARTEKVAVKTMVGGETTLPRPLCGAGRREGQVESRRDDDAAAPTRQPGEGDPDHARRDATATRRAGGGPQPMIRLSVSEGRITAGVLAGSVR